VVKRVRWREKVSQKFYINSRKEQKEMPHTQPEIHNPTTVFHENVGIGRNTQYGDRLFNERYDVLTLPVGCWMVLPTTLSHRVTRNNWGGFLQDQSYIRVCNTKEIAIAEAQEIKDCYGIDTNIVPMTVNVEVGKLAGINTGQLGDVYNQNEPVNGSVLRWDEGKPTELTLNYNTTLNAGDVVYQERQDAFGTVRFSIVDSNVVELINVRGIFKTMDLMEANLKVIRNDENKTVEHLLNSNNQPIRPVSVLRQEAHNGDGYHDYASYYSTMLNTYGEVEPTIKYPGDMWFNTNEGDLLMWTGDAWIETMPNILKDLGGGGSIDASLFSPVAFSGDYNDLINVPTSSGGAGLTGTGDTVDTMGTFSSQLGNAILDPLVVPQGCTIVVFNSQSKYSEANVDYVSIQETGGGFEYARGGTTAKWKNTFSDDRSVRLFVTENLEEGAEAVYIIFRNDIIDVADIIAQLATVASTGLYEDLLNAPVDITDFTDDSGFLSILGASIVSGTMPTERTNIGGQSIPLSSGDFWFDNITTGKLHVYDGSNWIQVT